MDVEIGASTVRGAASAPPSKSYTHRAILAAGYGGGATIEDPLWSADTKATARAVEAFGGDVARRGDAGDGSADEPTGLDDAPIEEGVDRTIATADEPAGEASPDDLLVEGFDGRPAVPGDVIDCANSGTTMRLTTATAALADGLSVLTGDESLRSRPQGPLLDAIEQLGGRAESTRGNGQAPLVVGGRASDGVGGTAPIEGGTTSIPGDVSSQFVTALLMAGAVTEAGVEVELETELKSAPYVDVTIELLSDFGVDARETDAGYAVAGGQRYEPDDGTYAVPGDFSSMSYLLAAGAVAAPDGLRVRGARPSAQGDSAIVGTLEEMGADLEWDRDAGVVEVAESDLTGTTVGVADTPDLLPTIAVLGAIADGTTEIVDAEHVRYKETDRVSAMAEALERLGAAVEEREDALVVHGGETDLQGATVNGRADHRVIMSLAVAGLVAEGETTITGAEHVDVSFPGFFDTLYDMGADVTRSR